MEEAADKEASAVQVRMSREAELMSVKNQLQQQAKQNDQQLADLKARHVKLQDELNDKIDQVLKVQQLLPITSLAFSYFSVASLILYNTNVAYFLVF